MISIKKEGLDKFRITTEMIVKMLQGPQIMTRGLQKGKINIWKDQFFGPERASQKQTSFMDIGGNHAVSIKKLWAKA